MADKDASQRRSTRQERALYQAGPKNEQRPRRTQYRDTWELSGSAKLGSPPASMEPTDSSSTFRRTPPPAQRVDPMEAVERKLAEMSMRGPPGYVNRSAMDKPNNFHSRPYSSNSNNSSSSSNPNNNNNNNNYQNNNCTTYNNRNSAYHSNDFSGHQSTDSLNGGSQTGERFNTYHGPKDNWNSRNGGRTNERQLSTSDGGYQDTGFRNDDGRQSSHGDNHRSSQYESSGPREITHSNFAGGRPNSDRFNRAERYIPCQRYDSYRQTDRDMPSRNHDSHSYQDRNNRQTNWRTVPRQNDAGSWRRGQNCIQQGDTSSTQRGFRDFQQRRLNDSRDSLHSVSSARSNDSRVKRASPVSHNESFQQQQQQQQQQRSRNDLTADSSKNHNEMNGRRSPRDENDVAAGESQRNLSPADPSTRVDRSRRDRRRRSMSRNKKTVRPEEQQQQQQPQRQQQQQQQQQQEQQQQRQQQEEEGARLQEPHELAEQRLTGPAQHQNAVGDSAQNHSGSGSGVNSDADEDRTQTRPSQAQPDEADEAEVAEITESAPEKPSRIDWSECPTPPPLEETCPRPYCQPVIEPVLEVEAKVNAYPEESWRNPRSRQNSESSSRQTSNGSSFRQWERQRDPRNQVSRGGRRSPPRDDFKFSSFHRRAQSPGSRFQDSKDRRPYERYRGSQGKRYSTFQDSLPPRFRKQKENHV